MLKLGAFCKCEQPSSSIYNFKGVVVWQHDSKKTKEGLSIENTIWASTVLASGSVWGLVVYCGKDTRIAQNSRVPNTKMGLFDYEVDQLAKMLFLMMAILTVIVTIFSRPVLEIKHVSVTLIRYLVLLSNIIPV